MLGKIKQFFSGLAGKSAGAALPPIVEPKVPNRPQSQPSASKRTATTKGDQRLAETDRRTANLDLLSLRSGTSTKATIRDLSKVSPDLSASVWAYQRLVVTKGFRAVGRNQDGTINQEATNLVQQLLARFNFLTDYSAGFSGTASVYSVAESLTRELRLYGSCSLELVLDKARLPSRLQPISTTQLIFHDDGSGSIYPVQKSPAGEIPLDMPIYLDSPMATQATALYQRHARQLRIRPRETARLCDGVTLVAKAADSEKLTRMRWPRVIISASGMATGGRVLHHIKAYAPDHRNLILFSGFQAAGTRGQAMLQGAKEIKIHGQYVPVRAEVAVLDVDPHQVPIANHGSSDDTFSGALK